MLATRSQHDLRRRLLMLLMLALAISLLAPSLPSSGTPAVGSGETAGIGHDPDGPGSVTVTLITGDRVHVHRVGDDRTAMTIAPAARRSGVVPQFLSRTEGDRTLLVPSDVLALVPDVLDPALFDVAGLVEQGFDDASSAALPLIVGYEDDVTAGARPMRGATTTVELPSINARAARLDKAEMTVFTDALSGSRPSEHGTMAAGPLAGVERIWLDAKLETTLHESVAQIEATDVWDLGFDGSGVTVAVLDSGIDERHPDLVDRVVAAVDLTDDEDPDDLNSHGTHVASIVGGTGAASAGERRGVAPGVDLINGKVLNADGFGFTSWAIAGVEWASASGADVVNMSFGAPPGIPGLEPLTAAVDNLSEEHGTLFVAAAGNGGCTRCIGQPADAARALTVGAVDRDDELAWFSSRGPVPGPHRLKPDVTAPGVGIEAALAGARGTGQEAYVAYSGTSMAAPHVAGAAAIVKQARPELDREQLKAALVATAQADPLRGPYDVGSGRIDVLAATSAPVLPDVANADFGRVPWPDDDASPATRTIAYTNHGTEPVELDLELDVTADDGVTVPPDVLRVEPASMALDPGASGSVEIVLEPGAGTVGGHAGVLVATAASGELRTPVGYVQEARTHEVRFETFDRDGRVVDPLQLEVIDREGSAVLDVTPTCSGLPFRVDPCLVLPEGTYTVAAFVATTASWQDPSDVYFTPLHTTLVADPEVEVGGDRTVVLDARDAVEVTVDTPAHDAHTNLGAARMLTWTRGAGPASRWAMGAVWNSPGSQIEERFFVTPTAPVATGSFAASTRWRLEETAISMSTHAGEEMDPRQYEPMAFSNHSGQWPQLEGDVHLPVVAAGSARPEDLAGLDLDGALALVERSDAVPVAEQSNRLAAAGAALVVVHNDVPGSANPDPGRLRQQLQVPTYHLSHDDGQALLQGLADGPVTVTARGRTTSPYSYDLLFTERAGVPNQLAYVAHPDELVTVEREFRTIGVEDVTYTETSFPFQPWERVVYSTNDPLLGAPRTRTDYHVSDPEIAWAYAIHIPEHPYATGPLAAGADFPGEVPPGLSWASLERPYAPAERTTHRFLAAPIAPGRSGPTAVQRLGDELRIEGAVLVDADGNVSEVATFHGITSRFQFWHGEELLGETTAIPSHQIGSLRLPPLPPDRQRYTIVHDVEVDEPWGALATRSEWTFGSAHVAGSRPESVDLLHLDYDLEADLGNRLLAPSARRGPNHLTVQAGYAGSTAVARLDRLSVDISYDDGRSWRSVGDVRAQAPGTYRATLPSQWPARADALSLRVTAVDQHGDQLEQRLIRAFGLPRTR